MWASAVAVFGGAGAWLDPFEIADRLAASEARSRLAWADALRTGRTSHSSAPTLMKLWLGAHTIPCSGHARTMRQWHIESRQWHIAYVP